MEERQETAELRCPFCVAEGKVEPVETPTTHIWVPALYERWVPPWAREKGFLSLEEAVRKAPALSALIKERKGGRKEAELVCDVHGRQLRDAKVWTSQLSWVRQKQAEAEQARAEQAMGSLASLLGGGKVAEVRDAVAKAEEEREKKPRGGKARSDVQDETKPQKRTRDTRAAAKRQTKEEIQEAVAEAASEETS